MKYILIGTLIIISLFSCTSGIEGEGAATASKTFAVDSFENLEANCNCDINLIPSESAKVVIESHQNLIDNLEINFKNSNLKIREKQPVSKFALYNVNVYFQSNLKEITLNHQAKMKVSGTLKSDQFEISANDQSNISQSFLDIKDFTLNLSDQSHADLNGSVIEMNLNMDSQSHAELSALQVVEMDVNASDNSQASLNVLKDLTGKAIDNAQIYYQGEPNKNTSEKDQALINKK